MALKDFIERFNKGRVEKTRKFKELEENFILNKRLAEKQKSSNERELEDFIRKEREERIKTKLDKFRKRQRDDTWKGSSVFGARTTILDNDQPILKDNPKLGIGKKVPGKGPSMGIGGIKHVNKNMFFKQKW